MRADFKNTKIGDKIVFKQSTKHWFLNREENAKKLEAGKTVPTILTLERAAKALKVGIEVIINGNINPIDNTNIKDKSLFEKMKMVDELPDEDKTAIFRMIELASKQKKFSEIFQTNTVRP